MSNEPTETKPVNVGIGTSDLFGLACKYWEAPFRYSVSGSCVEDNRGQMVIDVRGYGYLAGSGSLGLPDALACKIQDDVGEGITKLLNASWPNVKGVPMPTGTGTSNGNNQSNNSR